MSSNLWGESRAYSQHLCSVCFLHFQFPFFWIDIYQVTITISVVSVFYQSSCCWYFRFSTLFLPVIIFMLTLFQMNATSIVLCLIPGISCTWENWDFWLNFYIKKTLQHSLALLDCIIFFVAYFILFSQHHLFPSPPLQSPVHEFSFFLLCSIPLPLP